MKLSKLLATAAVTLGLGLTAFPHDIEAVYFRSCAQAWAAGYGDIYRGQDGYRRGLDRDGDGIACEIADSNGQYRPRRTAPAVPSVKNGWLKEGDYWYYYINGSRATNRWIDNEYYVKSDGRMAQNEWLRYGGAYYYLGDSGAYWRNRWKGDYFLQADGAMAVQKWVLYKNQWYYVNAKGEYLTSWQKVNGTWYYLDAYGVMVTGWRQINGTYYYLKADGAMATGWTQVKGLWYYLKSDGAMATGWQQVAGKWYYLNGDGAMVANKWQGDYYLGHDGAMLIDTVTPDGYRVDATGKWVPDPESSTSVESDTSSDTQAGSADETPTSSAGSSVNDEPIDHVIWEEASAEAVSSSESTESIPATTSSAQ